MTPPTAGANQFVAASLVSDGAMAASYIDPNLVNAWGIAFSPTGFAMVANNHTNTATMYDGNGIPQRLVVAIPAGAAGDAGPTGIVFNGTPDFQVAQNGATGASTFIVASEAGTIAAFAPAVNPTSAVTMFDGAPNGSIYKGLAIANFAGANYLYAADFHNNAIDVFNSGFAKVTLPGGFKDPSLPAGYAPFGIQAIGDRIYVAFAQQAATGPDEVAGPGLGAVDVFDTSGALIRQLAAGGALNAPWGIAMAPANFGAFSNALLVGNFGDGKINAYNPNSGQLMGSLNRSNGAPIVIDGLWAIAFGNGVHFQSPNTLYFAAGPSDETHGQYGRIDMR
jgi:uncharacterized protein (TIGR03118 family)